MMQSRLNRTLCLALIGLASFASLLPIALAVMNALKSTVDLKVPTSASKPAPMRSSSMGFHATQAPVTTSADPSRDTSE